MIFAAAVSIACANTKPTIGILLKNRVGYWALAEQGALAAGKELGATVVVKGAHSVSNPAWQVSLLHSLLEQKIDALVISPVNPEPLEPDLKAAIARGIKVVAFDAPTWQDLVNVSIEPDRVGVAKEVAKIVGSLVKDSDEVVFFRNNQGDLPLLQREEMMISEIKSLRPDLVIRSDIYANSGGNDPKGTAAFALGKYPNAKAILSTSTAGTMAMLDVLTSIGSAGKIKFVGFGTNINPTVASAINSGQMSAWFAQLPYDFGYMCVVNALSAIHGKEHSKNIVLDETSMVVTRKNLNDPKVQSLLKL